MTRTTQALVASQQLCCADLLSFVPFALFDFDEIEHMTLAKHVSWRGHLFLHFEHFVVDHIQQLFVCMGTFLMLQVKKKESLKCKNFISWQNMPVTICISRALPAPRVMFHIICLEFLLQVALFVKTLVVLYNNCTVPAFFFSPFLK